MMSLPGFLHHFGGNCKCKQNGDCWSAACESAHQLSEWRSPIVFVNRTAIMLKRSMWEKTISWASEGYKCGACVGTLCHHSFPIVSWSHDQDLLGSIVAQMYITLSSVTAGLKHTSSPLSWFARGGLCMHHACQCNEEKNTSFSKSDIKLVRHFNREGAEPVWLSGKTLGL